MHAKYALAWMFCVGAFAAASAVASPFEREIRPLLGKYCHGCHGNDQKPKGDLNLQKYADEAAILADRPVWKDVFDAIDLGDMPPRKAEHQLTADASRRLLKWIGDLLATPDLGGRRDPGKPMLRRLTRLEYNNTVRDLLRLKTDLFGFPERLPLAKDYFQPDRKAMPEQLRVRWREYGSKRPVLLRQAGLPGDRRAEHGFTNRGDAMNFSPAVFEKYLAMAEQIVAAPQLLSASPVARELMPGVAPPAPLRSLRRAAVAEEFDPARAMPRPKGPTVQAVADFAPRDNVVTVAPGSSSTPNRLTDLIASAHAENRGGVFDAPDAGALKAGVAGGMMLAFGVDRRHQLAVIPSEDLWGVSFATAKGSSGDHLIANRVKGRKVYDLNFDVFRDDPELGIAELGVVVLSRKQQAGDVKLTVTFSSGETASLTQTLKTGAGTDNTLFAFSAPAGHVIRRLRVDGSGFSGDYVLIDDIGFTVRPYERDEAAPAAEAAEPEAENAKPNKAPPETFEDDAVRERLGAFMKRAFRRPVSSQEAGLYFGIYRAAKQDGVADAEALRRALQAILASPNFLYIAEPVAVGAGPVRALSDHELAVRLSYFLWSTMPDDRLTQLADAGRLRDPDVLEREARRMLRDPKAKELSESFAFQWLRLNELLGARPDRRLFKAYYQGPQGKVTLTADLMIETLLLFETVVVEDRSVLDLIDARWGYLNPRLIRHYGLEEQMQPLVKQTAGEKRGANDRWFRIAWPDRRRGGVFTAGAALTLTSLPNRTSPIKRGAWMLETIFKRPPPPPAANAGELPEADPPGVKLTLRQKIERHRADPSCAVCHDRIDPLGFALEPYDGIGRWRTSDRGEPIDPAGMLPGGRAFANPVEFKDALLQRRQEFVRGFVEHMLSFALARKLEYFDDAAIKAITDDMARDDFRFSTLITGIVRSEVFRNVRNTTAKSATAKGE